MRPQDIPELRARTIAEFERDVKTPSPYSPTQLAKMERMNPDLMREWTAAVRHRDEVDQDLKERHVGPAKLLGHWRTAELFYVAPEMAQLAAAAGDSMPTFELHRDDPPAEIGLLYFDNSAWGKEFDVISTWDARGEALTLTVYTYKLGVLLYIGSLTVGYGEDLIESESHELRTWALVCRCCWLLMQQRIATVTDFTAPRAAMRRMQRAHQAVSPVRVITLRQPERHGVPTTDRSYRHRWVVRGHWRKQWYPSQERNVPIWISPYVKGPDGAPLLAGEKVYAWTR